MVLGSDTKWFKNRAVYTAFCRFLHFAQRAFCAARIRANAAADNFLFLMGVAVVVCFPLTLAQRARCAAAIRALPAADIVLLVLVLFPSLRAEIALLTCSSCDFSRERSCSSWLRADVIVDMPRILQKCLELGKAMQISCEAKQQNGLP